MHHRRPFTLLPAAGLLALAAALTACGTTPAADQATATRVDSGMGTSTLAAVTAVSVKRQYQAAAGPIDGYTFELINDADRLADLGLADAGVVADFDIESVVVLAPGADLPVSAVTIDALQRVGDRLYVQATLEEGDAGGAPYAAAVIDKTTGVTLRSDF